MTQETGDQDTRQAIAERIEAAGHAMQSGVAMEMNWTPEPTAPKHLRVGVNMALCGQAALVRLLVDKGLCTEDEINTALAEELEREVARYEARARAHLGHDGLHFR